MAATDQYRALSFDDPRRPVAWARAMRQTETARQLLEALLRPDRAAATEPERAALLA